HGHVAKVVDFPRIASDILMHTLVRVVSRRAEPQREHRAAQQSHQDDDGNEGSKYPEVKTAGYLRRGLLHFHTGFAVASSDGATTTLRPFCHCTMTARWRTCLPSRSAP